MDVSVAEDRVDFRLRRIGTPSTGGVPDLLSLDRSETHLGRHSESDIVLHSEELPQFLSRNHAVILRTPTSKGPQFVVRNKGLNGTYVNDIRIECDTVLDPGDIVQFGHPNALSIKPGERADRLEHEFIFRFEEEKSDMLSEYPESPVLMPVDSKGRPSGSQETPGVGSQNVSGASRKIFDSPTGTTVLKDIGNHASRSSPGKCLVHLDDLVNTSACSDQAVKVEKDPLHDISTDNDVFATAISQAVSFQDSMGSEEDIFSTLPVSATTSFSPVPGTSGIFTTTHNSPLAQSSTSSTNSANRSVGSIQKRRGRPPKKLTSPIVSPLQPTTSHAHTKSAKKQPKKKPEKRKRKSSSSTYKKKKQSTAAGGDGGEEKCDWYECDRPTGSTVDWVQCDDCDHWYHTLCVGCRLEDVEDNATDFHCGCLPK